jgi:5-methylcytosine-specific restriction enzyme subunit McrC
MDEHYDLTPSSFVGSIRIDDLAIQIRPKIDLERVLFVLSFVLDPDQWRSTPFHYDEESLLIEALVPGFIFHLEKAFSRGVLQGYSTNEEALQTVRGRIRVDDQIRFRFGLAPPIEVRYDDFTEDIEENRLIKAALRRLSLLGIRDVALRRSLRAFDAALDLVSDVDYDVRRLPDVTFNRLNDRYRSAIELSKLVIRSSAFELRHGAVPSTAVLFDMNKVFEDFVVVALRRALGASERDFPQGAKHRALFLDEAKRVRLKPDISWWSAKVCRFIGDIKYKRVSAEGIEHPDLYQLLSYTIASGLPSGLLIYASGESEAVSLAIPLAGKRLHIRTLDLSGSPDSILRQIDSLALLVAALSRNTLLAA